MGNQMSVPQRVEDQENDSETDSHKVASREESAQNGMVVSTYTVQLYDEVDLGISVEEEDVAASAPGATEGRSVVETGGKNLGKEAKPEAPAAKSRFFLTLSRPVPGRTGDQATDSCSGSAALDVSSSDVLGNKEPSDSMALPGAAARGHGPDKSPSETPTQKSSTIWAPVPLPPESGGAAPSKPKDSGFFDKLFKLDKGREKAPADNRQEVKGVERQDGPDGTPGVPRPPEDAPAEGDIVEGNEKGQEIIPVSCSVPRDSEELELAEEDPPTTAITENNNSIMSFFKMLVSPNKMETKKDLEDMGAEKSPTPPADLKSDKANFVPQETQGTAKNPAPTETAKEGAKEKGGPTSLPLSKLFWKKSVKEDSVPTGAEDNVVCESPVEITRSEDVDSALQTVDLNEEGDATPEPTEAVLRREERKPPRASLMAFLRQRSVKGDGGITHSEERDGKDSTDQTSDSPERAVAPAEPAPAGAVRTGNDGAPKAKRAAAALHKQRAEEATPRAEPAALAAQAVPDADRPPKRPEKRRQSLGGFFRGLGPKRMMDAQVQTDPVAIGPVGKPKCTGKCVFSKAKKSWPFPRIELWS